MFILKQDLKRGIFFVCHNLKVFRSPLVLNDFPLILGIIFNCMYNSYRASELNRVLIIHSTIKQYREPFFDGLFHALKIQGIELRVVFGLPTPTERSKKDTFLFVRPWAYLVNSKWFLQEKILYQSVVSHIRWADLIIVEQANKHLINYPLLLWKRFLRKKVAFWGHGRNRQVSSAGLGEYFKRCLLKSPDWWFAYTRGVAAYLEGHGVPQEIITNIQNSIDTTELKTQLASVSCGVVQRMKDSLCGNSDATVGLYCGSLYPDKQIEFLLDSACRIRSQCSRFHIVIIGGGAQEHLIAEASKKLHWVHYIGPQFGLDKAVYFRLADFFLNPGMVGLSIIDAFCAGLPMVTTDYFGHSPEIDYLKPGINGLVSKFEPQAYASVAVELCRNNALLLSLRQGARDSSAEYSLEMMVQNVSKGICKCLAS